MISLLVYIVILVVVMIFLWWLMQQIPLPEPLQKIAMIVLVAVGVISLITILLQVSGGGFGTLHLPR